MAAPGAIPVIDLFAGPGGLGEGFSRFAPPAGRHPFKIGLSIEKDEKAHETLLLRSFFRQSPIDDVPEAYYECLRGELTRDELFEAYPADAEAAKREAWCTELGVASPTTVRERISAALGDTQNWVLIGGPPCQAYSLVGRSRNKGKVDYRPAEDRRHFLYMEYLQIIADHWPAVFVMENVKGLLSAAVDEERIFTRILNDLRSPSVALKREERNRQRNGRAHCYRIHPVVESAQQKLFDDEHVADFIVRAEDFGVPQARHRLILVGIREDCGDMLPMHLRRHDPVPARLVLRGLPRLRSGLSKVNDSAEAWRQALQEISESKWLKGVQKNGGKEIRDRMLRAVDELSLPRNDRGAEFIRCDADIDYRPDWFLDPRIGGVCNHTTRGHITSDLYRYLFAACFAEVEQHSPELSEFPPALRPDHENVNLALGGAMFADRFRVQLAGRPSTTVTSHIAKDGHYYIHYDPSQCRSLTVREAARLQTFPDNYFFCGPRTAQYHQVGNAVPPLLAVQIAEVVWDLLRRAGTL
jgi:DNA (cytosine-5)-methyltransferase 1